MRKMIKRIKSGFLFKYESVNIRNKKYYREKCFTEGKHKNNVKFTNDILDIISTSNETHRNFNCLADHVKMFSKRLSYGFIHQYRAIGIYISELYYSE